MTTTFESISLKGLRLAHLRQLRTYVHSIVGYYGPKEQFYKRHVDILEWIDNAVEHAESKDVRLPL